MRIIKYASKSCIKCRVLDKVFEYVELPCEVETIYSEDAGETSFVTKGIDSLPTLEIINEDKKVRLTGTITPVKLEEAIKQVQ